MLSYEQRRDWLLGFIRKQNILWDKNIETEEKARKPLKPLKAKPKVELLNKIPRKRY